MGDDAPVPDKIDTSAKITNSNRFTVPSIGAGVNLTETPVVLDSSIICTPLSSTAVTMAYVLEPIVNVLIPHAPSSISEGSSVNEIVALMFVGSLTSIICTPSSANDVTMAYVLASTVNVSTPSGS